MSNCCDLKQCIYYDPEANNNYSSWEPECQDCWHSKYNIGYGTRCNFVVIHDMIGRTSWFEFDSKKLSLIPDEELIKEIKRRKLKIED